eukprot:PITA_28047
MLTCRLEFDCTNNTAEYEALVQGLYKAIGLNVKYLQVFGDSKIVVRQEYEVEIKPASIVKGQGFCKMLAGASLISEIPSTYIQVYEVSLNDNESLYVDIICYMKNGYAPSHLDYTKKRALRLKGKQYQLLNNVLFRINYDFVLLRCLEESEAKNVLQELHDRPAGGHYVGDATAHKILSAGYYWHTLFKDSHNYVRKCQVCQTSVGRQKKSSSPLQLDNIEQPFDQWGLDIIDQFIITRFGLPSTLMFDNASYFSGNAMTEFALKRGIKLKYSANYYPQGKGLAESTNKNLIRIIKRTVDQNHKNWHKSLIYALWADQITKKASIGTSPSNLVYGKEEVLPTHLAIPSLSLVQYIDEVPTSSLQLRQMEIIKLEEQREQAKRTHAHHQALVKSSFDSNMMTRKDFQMGDLVLKWDKAHEEKGKHTKF